MSHSHAAAVNDPDLLFDVGVALICSIAIIAAAAAVVSE